MHQSFLVSGGHVGGLPCVLFVPTQQVASAQRAQASGEGIRTLAGLVMAYIVPVQGEIMCAQLISFEMME